MLQQEKSPGPMTSTHILLVEYNTADVELFMAVLLQYNSHLRVEHVRDAAEALEYLSKTALPEHGQITKFPKLIVLDLKMQGIDGFQFLHHIKCHSLLRIIPILVLTASAEHEEIQRCFQLGANACMVKPTGHEAYSELVKSFCDFWLNMNHLPVMISEHLRSGVGQNGLWFGQ